MVEPLSGDGGAPPFDSLLKKYDKNNDGKLQISGLSGEGLSDKIMYRIGKSIDRNTGNNDGVVTEEEWTKAFNASDPGGGLGHPDQRHRRRN
jgi:Ca2+-binding EF-hand superfamily protein